MKRSTRASSVGLSTLRSSTGNFTTRFSSPSFVDRVEALTTEQKDAIKRAGFGNLLLIPNQTINRKLLVELIDNWSCEKCAFVLPHGELSITPLDIALIVGLNVCGNPVLLKEDDPFSDLELEYGATPDKRKISIQSLEKRLDSLGETADDDFVRTFLLCTFGYFLFPNSSNNVDTRYLSFLRNVDDIRGYAWGEAVLEELLLWLNKRKESSVQYFGGCLTFLQVWSFEHLDIARPNLINDMAFPRACRWENRKPNPRQSFTGLFQELKGDQVIWTLEPTSYELEIDVVRSTLEIEDVVDEDASSPIANFSPSSSVSAPVLGSNCSLQVPDSDTELETDVAKDTPGFEKIYEPQRQEMQTELESNCSLQVPDSDTELETDVAKDAPRFEKIYEPQPQEMQTDEPQPQEMQTELDLLSEADCPTVSSYKSEVASSPKETLELPITSMVKEDEWRLKYEVSQEHVVELEKEISDLTLENEEMNDLRLENKLLYEQTLSIPVLEEENRKLKEEVVNLKRELKNSVSFDPHAARIEKLIAMYDAGVTND